MAYNQIKRKDEEFRSLNAEILQMKETGLDTTKTLMEYKRQIDDKDALLKELKMTHKLQEMEDAHTIAELKQRVASLEVTVQEILTTGQLNDNEKILLCNGIGASTDKLNTDDMKYLLMASNTSLTSDFFRSNQQLNRSNSNAFPQSNSTSTEQLASSAQTTLHKNNNNSDVSSGSLSDLSSSLTSIPKTVHDGKSPKQQASLNRSRSEGSPYEKRSQSMKTKNTKASSRNSPINESANSPASSDGESELNKSLPSKLVDVDAAAVGKISVDNVPVKTTSMGDLAEN